MLSERVLVLRPGDFGKTAEVTDESGTPVATFRGGQLTGASGEPLLRLALQEPGRMSGRRDDPTRAVLEVGDAQGRPVGSARIAKYSFGPRAKKLTLVLTGSGGEETGRIEPADDHGRQLSATAAGAEVATVSVEQVKVGFLRKARVYTVRFADEPSPLLLGAILGYEGLLSAAQAAAMRD